SRPETEDQESYEDRPRSRAPREEDDDRPRRRPREDDEEGDYDSERESAETSGKAIAALLLGLSSFCFSAFTAVPAIIVALMSLGDINRSRGRLRGKALAVAGLLLGCAGLVATAVGLFFGIRYAMSETMTKVQEATETIQVSNNM